MDDGYNYEYNLNPNTAGTLLLDHTDDCAESKLRSLYKEKSRLESSLPKENEGGSSRGTKAVR
jgi:hypothetical protein